MKRRIKRFAMVLLAMLLCGCTTAAGEEACACGDRSFQILFISSYSYSWPTVPLQIRGIVSALDDSVSLDVEFMDTKAIPEDLAAAQLRERIAVKERNQNYDAVIVGDDAALIFAINHRAALFPDIPIVFEGINNLEYAEAVSRDPLITGVIEGFSYDDNLEFARKVQPNATKVVAIVDNTPSGIGEQQQFFEQRERFPELTFAVINSSELTKKELIEAVSSVVPDTILLYLILSEDADGNVYTIEQSSHLLRDNAQVPVYRFVQAGVGEGVLGGKIVLHQTSGAIAAEMTMQMLCEHRDSPVEMRRESPNGFYLDAQVMAHFGIPESLIPQGAVVINREPGFWETYGMTVLITLAISCGVAAIVGLVLHGMIQRRHREALNLQNRQLAVAVQATQEANRAKSVFLHSMSHDIRTPMNAIMGFTDIAKKLNTNENVGKYLDKISTSSEHLLGLINDVLDISRIESGKVPYTPVPTNLCSLTDSVLEIAQGFLAGRSLDFRVDRPQEQGHCMVMTDPVRIREILVNLLSNAVKFTDDGGTIIFSMGRLPGQDDRHTVVFFQVSDTGCGMSEAFLPHLFEEFSQEENDARTRYKGTGLGMAITKRYVDMMGGTITVNSIQGVGSTFLVKLPVELAEENVCRQTAAPLRDDLKGIRVLVVEDNEMNAEIVRFQLEDVGMVVTTVEDGQQAVDLFAEKPAGSFDVILMDVMMPVLDGHQATRKIRAMENRPDGKIIPIIAMTANAFSEDVQASLDAGMDAHLSKPLAMEEVMKTIARLIR